ncbi:hypothetical protein [Embleya sp. NPDC020630]|uniref:hypothetical protein n=1 Tax=Embleya sp. NPDC020630 TaxID=3363979 RepID=UPI003795A010
MGYGIRLRLPWGGWCVRDTAPAQTLLRDPEYHAGGSVFFGELLPAREAQAELGRAVRGLLRAGVPLTDRACLAVTAFGGVRAFPLVYGRTPPVARGPAGRTRRSRSDPRRPARRRYVDAWMWNNRGGDGYTPRLTRSADPLDSVVLPLHNQ